jgi:hypothetical protein
MSIGLESERDWKGMRKEGEKDKTLERYITDEDTSR